MKFNTIIFDFDGTLADTNKIIMDAWQEAYRILTNHEGNEEEIKATYGEPLALSLEKAFPDVPVEESIKIYRGYQKDRYEETLEPFDGMVDLIKSLKDAGCKVGIVTSRRKQSTMIGLEKFGIVPYLDGIITDEDCKKHKPDPAPMYAALKKLNADPSETLMIGDTLFDIRCAHNAGVRAVHVGWAMALSDPPEEGPDKPDYIIEKAEDLMKII